MLDKNDARNASYNIAKCFNIKQVKNITDNKFLNKKIFMLFIPRHIILQQKHSMIQGAKKIVNYRTDIAKIFKVAPNLIIYNDSFVKANLYLCIKNSNVQIANILSKKIHAKYNILWQNHISSDQIKYILRKDPFYSLTTEQIEIITENGKSMKNLLTLSEYTISICLASDTLLIHNVQYLLHYRKFSRQFITNNIEKLPISSVFNKQKVSNLLIIKYISHIPNLTDVIKNNGDFNPQIILTFTNNEEKQLQLCKLYLTQHFSNVNVFKTVRYFANSPIFSKIVEFLSASIQIPYILQPHKRRAKLPKKIYILQQNSVQCYCVNKLSSGVNFEVS
jgi:hypothetical protein